MKATILVNRHVVNSNKKNQVDHPCISINTSAGIIYCKEIGFSGPSKLIQDANHPRTCGATIWIEAQFEDLIIDGTPATRDMLPKKASPVSALYSVALLALLIIGIPVDDGHRGSGRDREPKDQALTSPTILVDLLTTKVIN
jgi:hypothetical protein